MPPPSSAPRQVWERDGVLAAAARVLDGAGEGSGAALFIVGEAGLGKTTVLEHTRLAAAGMDVAFGRGEPMEASIPFGLIAQAVESLGARELLGTNEAGAVAAVEPSVPFHRVLRWLEERERPVLLAFDDLHWADVDSLRVIAFLARRVAQLPVALIGTLRPWPSQADDVVRSLVTAGDAVREDLAPLSRAAADALLAERWRAEISDATASHTWELTRGNPLLMEHVAPDLGPVGDVVEPAPALGERLLLPRFAGLDDQGLQCVRAASVLGTEFAVSVVAEIAELDERVVGEVLEGLFRSGLVDDAGHGNLRFVHPLFGQALYDDLAPPAQRRFHARAFEALARRGHESEACEHAIRAELQGDERAVGTLERAGRAALATGAVNTAVRQLDAAVRFSSGQASGALLVSYCQALTATQRMEEAATVCRQLLAQPDLAWDSRVDALRMLGRALYLSGAREQGAAVLNEAIALASEHDPARAVQPLLDLALTTWLIEGPRAALALTGRARDLAHSTDDTATIERADASWGHLAFVTGDPDGLRATAPLVRYLEGGVGVPQLDATELTWPWAAIYHYASNANYSEHHAQAEEAFRLARRAAEEAGAANTISLVSIFIANVLIRRGRLEEALDEAIRAEEFADLTPLGLAYAALARAEALAWAGSFDESERWCATVEMRAPAEWFGRVWLAHVRGMRLLWQGDAAASDMFIGAEELTRAVGIAEPCHVQWSGHAIAAHLANGRDADAERVIEWLETCAASLPCRWPRIAATVGRAELSARAGHDEIAERQFRDALALHEQVDLPLHRLEALLAYGDFLRRSGRPADARDHLANAAGIAETTGAVGLGERAREELKLAGGRRRRRTPDPAQLTPAEERVAEVAAAGHTNAEIARQLHISVNTVETHLKRVYAKLGISSRRQLMSRGPANNHRNRGR